MTVTARHATARIAAATAALADQAAFSGYDSCDLCALAADSLYTRLDNRDGTEIRVCEHCADHGDVSHTDDYDI